MKTKEKINSKEVKSKKIKRKVSIITVFLWLFLVVIMITIVRGNIKNTNALEEEEQQQDSILGNNIGIYPNNQPNPDYGIVEGKSIYHR